MNRITMTKITAKIGKKIDIMDMNIDVPVSIVDTIGFPNPPVVVVDVNLMMLEELEIAAAVPPPAMMASDHVMTGLKSTIVDIITAVPAKAAKGTEILSNKLSI